MSPLEWSLLLAVLAALASSLVRQLRGLAFGLWVLVAFLAPLRFPAPFLSWGGFDLAVLIVPLIQIIMFGMGTTLTPADFRRALRQPLPVAIGIAAQYLVMPLVAWGLGHALGLEPSVIVGMILVGSVSGGVASNLMAFLARGDVALSVTMTACSTLLSPVMTPLLTKGLAGTLVPISFPAMMVSILNMIIAPIVAGLLAHEILYGRRGGTWGAGRLLLLALFGFALGVACAAFDAFPADASPADVSWLEPLDALRPGLVVGVSLIALAALVKAATVACGARQDWVGRALPMVSMLGIWIIIAIITARSRETLMAVGGLLVVAAIIHNVTGYLVGYGAGRLGRLPERRCRTIALEVGMQNSGMAAGIAIDVLQDASAALAPAIFSPCMNISGSLLASWWGRRSDSDQARDDAAAAR